MQDCSLSAQEIACRRGDRILFRGVNLSLSGGAALHITAANGVGKSSLMRILAGLLLPFNGAVSTKGAIGLLDERPALDPQTSLAGALRFWGEVDGCDNPQELALLLGVEELLDVPFRYLSTGQRKRAAFIRLLNQAPPIWLLDEPLNGLDRDARDRITSLVRLHCEDGGICVIASHQPIDLPEIMPFDLEGFVQ